MFTIQGPQIGNDGGKFWCPKNTTPCLIELIKPCYEIKYKKNIKRCICKISHEYRKKK